MTHDALASPAKTGSGTTGRSSRAPAGGLDGDRAVWPFSAPGSAAVAVLGFTLALCLVSALTLDAPVAVAAAALPPAMRKAAAWITILGLSNYMLVGSAAVVIVASLVLRRTSVATGWARWRLARERAAFFFASVAGSGLLAQLIKHVVGRARPKLFDQVGAFHFDILSIKASLASFPSGHATSAFAAATVLGAILPRWRIPLVVLAILIGASRVAVGAHYVSDVVAGAGLGILVALGMAALFARRGEMFVRVGPALVLRRGSVAPKRPEQAA